MLFFPSFFFTVLVDGLPAKPEETGFSGIVALWSHVGVFFSREKSTEDTVITGLVIDSSMDYFNSFESKMFWDFLSARKYLCLFTLGNHCAGY